MRGRQEPQISLLCALNPEDLVSQEHPLRQIKRVADKALAAIDTDLEGMYSQIGRPSIAPERLLKSMLLMSLFSIRSDRQLCEQIRYNLLYRWFLDMDMTEKVWDRSVFSHNRDRLIEHDIARALFGSVIEQARAQALISEEHFSVDGTLIEAWASMKSFVPKDSESNDDDEQSEGGSKRNPWKTFRGKKRSNQTHASTTDPEARLMRKGKGKEAKLCFTGHLLMENRNGLAVDIRVSEATGTCEREQALAMLDDLGGKRRITLGADRGYHVRSFLQQCREMNVTPHVAEFSEAGANRTQLDRRTTRHPGYRISQRIRKRVEECFGWAKSVGGLARSRYRGTKRTELFATIVATALNVLRIAKLQTAHPPPG